MSIAFSSSSTSAVVLGISKLALNRSAPLCFVSCISIHSAVHLSVSTLDISVTGLWATSCAQPPADCSDHPATEGVGIYNDFDRTPFLWYAKWDKRVVWTQCYVYIHSMTRIILVCGRNWCFCWNKSIFLLYFSIRVKSRQSVQMAWASASPVLSVLSKVSISESKQKSIVFERSLVCSWGALVKNTHPTVRSRHACSSLA